jgi:hypothetical protein
MAHTHPSSASQSLPEALRTSHSIRYIYLLRYSAGDSGPPSTRPCTPPPRHKVSAPTTSTRASCCREHCSCLICSVQQLARAYGERGVRNTLHFLMKQGVTPASHRHMPHPLGLLDALGAAGRTFLHPSTASCDLCPRHVRFVSQCTKVYWHHRPGMVSPTPCAEASPPGHVVPCPHNRENPAQSIAYSVIVQAAAIWPWGSGPWFWWCCPGVVRAKARSQAEGGPHG